MANPFACVAPTASAGDSIPLPKGANPGDYRLVRTQLGRWVSREFGWRDPDPLLLIILFAASVQIET